MTTNTARNEISAFDARPYSDLYAAWLGWLTKLLADDRMPLSGDVTQWIRAWGEAVGQIGLLNINYAGSGDPQAERRISGRYSYGRQLGRMMEVLAPYVRSHESEFTDKPDGKALKEFLHMADDIGDMKQASVGEIVDKVRQWRKSPDFKSRLDDLRRGLEALNDGA